MPRCQTKSILSLFRQLRDPMPHRQYCLTTWNTRESLPWWHLCLKLGIYTRVDDGSSHSKVGGITGGVIGALAGLLIIAFVIFCIRRRRRKQHTEGQEITAYPIHGAYSASQHLTDRSALSGKAALRQAELDRLERAMHDIRHQNDSPSPSTNPAPHPPISSSVGTGHTESELASQIAELRMEIADLRNRSAEADAVPPPRYE